MLKRLYYLDNLRVFLTMLVIVFHTSIAYGGAGSWYYEDVDKSQINATIIVLTIFTAVCQAFFMALFFFVSGYFTPKSYDRKGPLRFLSDRLLRLGIPMVLYMLWLGPTTIYLAKYRDEQTYAEFFRESIMHVKKINFGPLWFAEALIYFALFYVLYRMIFKKSEDTSTRPIAFPVGARLLGFALGSGLAAFLTRFVFPLGTGPLELQLGYFPLYILLYIAGILAYRHNWLEQIPSLLSKVWLRTALILIPVFPLLLIVTGALSGNLTYSGGLHLQAFLYAMWEPFICFGVSLGLLCLFQRRMNKASRLMDRLSKLAYTAYIIHPVVVVSSTLLMHQVNLAPLLKFIIVAPVSVVLTFAAAQVIYKIPYADRIL
ncbi:acyltransferase family protein [Paenibacillus rhizophilus]|uniref:Acyltransferase n=1 Tax=Paenibacillus rhizophilus TaxID=1850366 RepID=A0A3N9PBS0_9BACL|nr:acyltransferase family protein [Paenibacillus rhizophilus]RQW13688.1 acyltransferase [Paenibacillus rhizophilus]